MEFVFKILKKVTFMENPSKNSSHEEIIAVIKDEVFEKQENDTYVFKLLLGEKTKVILEYDRHYLVKNEHKGNEFHTTLTINQPKQITSMWGPKQITYEITYLGIYGEDFKE